MSANPQDNPLVAFSEAMAQAADQAGQATVMVDARRRLPASGVLYGPDRVLTADHVVESDENIGILLPDGTEASASLAGRDPGSDLALLHIESASGAVARAASEAPRVGQFALAIGRPSPEGLQASLGVVSAMGTGVRVMRRKGKGRRGPGFFHKQAESAPIAEQFIRTDAIPYPGFSGGPLINVAGEVIGVNTSGLMRGISIAIPVARAWKIADSLEKHGSVRRGYLGIRSQPVQLQAAQQSALDRDQEQGLLIIWVEEGSPAGTGGLMVGDILVGINGTAVADAEELQIQLAGDVVGRQTAVEVLRGGQPVQVQFTIGERK